MLWFMGSQIVGHDWAELKHFIVFSFSFMICFHPLFFNYLYSYCWKKRDMWSYCSKWNSIHMVLKVISSSLHSHSSSVINLRDCYNSLPIYLQLYNPVKHMCTSIGVADTVSHSTNIHFSLLHKQNPFFFRQGVASVPYIMFASF